MTSKVRRLADRWKIRAARRSDSSAFLGLVIALAKFEHLEPPDREARRRMTADIFEKRKLHLIVAESGRRIVGYALYFYTYSSFLAKPTLYIEDLLVLKGFRRLGIGRALFRRCAAEASKRRCGRLEFSVLTWNSRAIGFYRKLGARRMEDWALFRLDTKALKRLSAGVSQCDSNTSS